MSDERFKLATSERLVYVAEETPAGLSRIAIAHPFASQVQIVRLVELLNIGWAVVEGEKNG